MKLKKGDVIRFPEFMPCNNGNFIPVLYTPKQNIIQKLSNKLRKKNTDSVLIELTIMTFNRR